MSIAKITKYVTYYIGSATTTHDAEIDLFDDRKRTGILYFYGTGKSIPQDKMTVNGVYLHFSLDRFHDVLHILQTEKPLYIRWHSGRKVGYIQTSMEPAGEEENE